MDLFEDDMPPGGNAREYSVGEITGAVKRILTAELGHIRVRGEVGRVFRSRSGHVYFDLKDDRSVLSCVTWKSQLPGIGVVPEEGLEIVAEGRMGTTEYQSKYSLNALRVEVAGEGRLMALLERRRKQLAAEGLFDEARKKPLPSLPETIGVVTSPQGAVIRDILHRLRDRFPRPVLVWPVAVQGDACAGEVARAVEGFNRLAPGGDPPRPDLLIVARGGGSIEDLWGFNEEEVVRAVAASDIPVISAIGHETDVTLIDHAADRRAPTPTAAAEIAVPVRLDLLADVERCGAGLANALSRALRHRRTRVADLARALPRPDALTGSARQRLDHLDARLPSALSSVAARGRARLGEAAGSLRPAALRRMVAGRRRELGLAAARLAPLPGRRVARCREALEGVAARARPERLARGIGQGREEVGALWRRLASGAEAGLARRAGRLRSLDRLRQTLGYTATLARGYAVVRGPDGVVTRVRDAERAGALEIEFADGRIGADARPGSSGAAGGASGKKG